MKNSKHICNTSTTAEEFLQEKNKKNAGKLRGHTQGNASIPQAVLMDHFQKKH